MNGVDIVKRHPWACCAADIRQLVDYCGWSPYFIDATYNKLQQLTAKYLP